MVWIFFLIALMFPKVLLHSKKYYNHVCLLYFNFILLWRTLICDVSVYIGISLMCFSGRKKHWINVCECGQVQHITLEKVWCKHYIAVRHGRLLFEVVIHLKKLSCSIVENAGNFCMYIFDTLWQFHSVHVTCTARKQFE